MADNNDINVALAPADHADAEPTHARPGVEEEEEIIDAKYSLDSLAAIIKPVMITMIIASLAVLYIRDASTDSSVASGLSTYLVYQDNSGAGGGSSSGSGGGDQPSSSDIGQALVNALVIVGVVCGATFVLVACYYFRCLKLMLGYLTFAMTSLLGYSGGFMVITAVTVWQIPLDWPTFVFIMYNFAVVGVWSIMYGRGVPILLGQAYLVSVSVIMAWVLTKLPEWTSWTLLVVLALYDLCAVLTPCGPLRALVNLAQERRDPLPGLLYDSGAGREEPLPRVVAAVPGTGQAGAGDTNGLAQAHGRPTVAVKVSPPGSSPLESLPQPNQAITVVPNPAWASTIAGAGAGAEAAGHAQAAAHSDYMAMPEAVHASARVRDWPGNTGQATATSTTTGMARQTEGEGGQVGGGAGRGDGGLHTDAGLQQEEEEEEGGSFGSSGIKLGLGDFVFYSVLVSRAALYDASTLAACFVAVIAGLGGTLFLLSIAKKALPALPISIFLGVAVYVCTRYAVTPMLADLAIQP